MKVYLAGSGHIENCALKRKFYSFYRLESFYTISKTEREHIHLYDGFLLDSGAYTFIKSGEPGKDWVRYVEEYAEFINRYKVSNFFELDIDPIVGLKEVERLRSRLENATGKKSIPVWHKSRGKEYWKQMVKYYNYVSIGGIATKEIKRTEYPFLAWLLSEAKTQNCKVHGLGFTNFDGLKKYKFDSVDSTSWLSGNRFGAVYMFNGTTLTKHLKKPGQRVKTKETAIHNFQEWVKFSKYAEVNL